MQAKKLYRNRIEFAAFCIALALGSAIGEYQVMYNPAAGWHNLVLGIAPILFLVAGVVALIVAQAARRTTVEFF